MKQKPGILKVCRYAILKCLSESGQMDFESLHRYTRMDNKRIVTAIGRLLGWYEIKKDNSNKKVEYIITKAGKRKLAYYEKHGYGDLWKRS